MNTQTINRLCKKCGETKSIEQFQFSHKEKGYRRHECKSCSAVRVEANHKANREHRLQRMRDRYRQDPTKFWSPERRKRANQLAVVRNVKLRDMVIAAYGGKCKCCGEKEPLFLTLDHVNNDGSRMRKHVHGKASPQIYMWAIKNKFPKTFQLLCMNCNFGKSRNKGICPHTK